MQFQNYHVPDIYHIHWYYPTNMVYIISCMTFMELIYYISRFLLIDLKALSLIHCQI